MAGKLFIGFDVDKRNDTFYLGAGVGVPATEWNDIIMMPRGVYHNKGAASSNYAGFYATTDPNGFGIMSYGPWIGGCYGGSRYDQYTPYTGAARTSWASAQGHQLGLVRSEIGLLGDLYVTFDILMNCPSTASLASSYEPTDTWARVFRFGDVEVACKEVIYSALGYTFIFTVRNNNAEIATVTVPNIPAKTDWLFCKMHVKLDATTGVIDFSVNAVNQSVAFASGNTVNTTSLAAATILYIGPPVLHNGTDAHVGMIDNIYFDDAAFPAGRPRVAVFTLLADDTLTNFAAVGTSPTTVVDALSWPTDAKAARATAANGVAVLTQTPPATTSFLTDLVGIEMFAKNASNRNPNGDRRVQLGYSLAGVETMGLKSKGTPLPSRSTDPPPSTTLGAAWPVEQIFETSAGTKMTKAQFATMKVVIKSAAP